MFRVKWGVVTEIINLGKRKIWKEIRSWTISRPPKGEPDWDLRFEFVFKLEKPRVTKSKILVQEDLVPRFYIIIIIKISFIFG